MTELAKTTTILHKPSGWTKGVDSDQVYFCPEEEPDEIVDVRRTELQLDKAVWEDMGSPDTITVTIESGDKLNTVENHAKIADAYEIFQGVDKLWYVRLLSNNGETIFTSEGYAHESHAAKIAADTGLPPREV